MKESKSTALLNKQNVPLSKAGQHHNLNQQLMALINEKEN